MRICVCGAQSLYMRGGAELLHENLAGALRAAGHEVEIVRVPTDWSRANLLASAFAWRLLSLNSDLVVATNFPSYFVRHPRKVVWLTHQHRAAYDALGKGWSDFGDDDRSLEQHREVIEWDSRALGESARLFAISRRVADRLSTFNGLASKVLYHPPPLFGALHGGRSGDYIFCATRLEANKRPELMVEAMAHVGGDTRLVIAGRGSLAESLGHQIRRLSLQARVTLLGFVNDADVVELFANAMAVIYVPFDEDYGYVPLQAFYAHKPVITTDDSGAVLEWVEDGLTGAVVAPTAVGLAQAIERVRQDEQRRIEQGRAGGAAVRSLSWHRVVDTLLAE